MIENFRWIRPGTSCPPDPTIFEGEEGQEGRILEGRGLEERFFGKKQRLRSMRGFQGGWKTEARRGRMRGRGVVWGENWGGKGWQRIGRGDKEKQGGQLTRRGEEGGARWQGDKGGEGGVRWPASTCIRPCQGPGKLAKNKRAGDHSIMEDNGLAANIFLNIVPVAVITGFQCNKCNLNVLNHVSWLKTLPNSDGKSFLNFSAKNVLLAKQLLQCLSFQIYFLCDIWILQIWRRDKELLTHCTMYI